MIREYFKDKTILITGTTGFLGKVLLERILWEVPQVRRVRLLVRAPAGSGSADDRARQRLVNSLSKSPAFERLHERQPDFQGFLDDKLEVYDSDLLKEDLGLSPESESRLFDGLDAVIHIAASVSWDERFDYSVRINTLAALRLLELARKTEPRPRFVHISSAFVHGQRNGRVFEEPFDPARSIANEMGKEHRFELDREIEMALTRGEEVMAEADRPQLEKQFRDEAEKLAAIPKYADMPLDKRIARQKNWHIRSQLSEYGRERALRNGWIDSYTFSKAMAEMVLTRSHGDVPLAIVRPPGITSAMGQPMKGWLEGYHLVEPLVEGVGRGMITAFPGNPQTVVDTVPVDYVVNLIMAACATHDRADRIPIYQIGTSHLNPINLKDISRIWLGYFEKNPMRNTGGEPIETRPPRFYPNPEEFVRFYQQRRKRPLTIAGRLLEAVPFTGHIKPLDKARQWIAKKEKQIDKLCKFSDLYSAYTVNSWIFVTDNTMGLLKSLPADDQQQFNFDSSKIDWHEYWTQTHIPGMRRYVIQETGA